MQPGPDVGHGAGDHGVGSQTGDHGAGDHGGGDLHADPPEEKPDALARWTDRLKGIATGITTIFFGLVLVAVAGWIVSRFWTINRLEEEITRLKAASDGKAEKSDVTNLREKLEGKAETVPVQNSLNSHQQEIEKLQLLVSTYNASYNNAIGKYDTLLQKHEAEVASLRTKADSLCEKAAKLEVQEANSGADLKQLKDVKIEKVTTEVATLREKIASLEASLKSLELKK